MSIQGSVSALSLVYMCVSAVLAILLPIGIIIWFAVKKRLNVKAMLIGAAFFVLFALFLESALHILVLKVLTLQSFLLKNPIMYGLYGGLAAGIFEETARLAGFKLIVRDRELETVNTGLSYGLGHGGCEAILVGGLAIIGNIINAVLINNGMMNSLLKAMPAAQAETARQSLNWMISAPSYIFGVDGFERVVALVIQVSLSILVFKAVVERKWIYYIYAIIIHAVIDFPAALYQAGAIRNVFVIELTALIFAILLAFAAYKLRPVFNAGPAVPDGAGIANDEDRAENTDEAVLAEFEGQKPYSSSDGDDGAE